jgi:hypothetical protein
VDPRSGLDVMAKFAVRSLVTTRLLSFVEVKVKVKVMFSCLTKHQVAKAYGRLEA